MTFDEWYSTHRHLLGNEIVCRVIWEAAQRERAPQWQPIETAPKDGTEFLAWWIGGEGRDALGAHRTYWLDNSKTDRPWAGWRLPSMVAMSLGSKPTHWMRIEAPKP
jgi:hypothetical protein